MRDFSEMPSVTRALVEQWLIGVTPVNSRGGSLGVRVVCMEDTHNIWPTGLSKFIPSNLHNSEFHHSSN